MGTSGYAHLPLPSVDRGAGHPARWARLFPGRVILGVGTGESLNEVPSTGAPWPDFKERFARLREAVTLIRTLWRGERISFEGQY